MVGIPSHNLKAAGSNPAPATNLDISPQPSRFNHLDGFCV